MQIRTIDAEMLKKMILAGARRLESNKEYINELNVFPVPDGDTGTNMTMTIMSAARAVNDLKDVDMKNLSKAISGGALRGARGNSGVILSQLFGGFTKVIRKKDVIDAAIARDAFRRASETAYKAVMKPKEGTILTVARGMSDKASDVLLETDDLAEALRQIIEYGNYILSLTPEMLPVLKQAGVVDSGGQGLMTVMEGAYDALIGKESAQDLNTDAATTASQPVSSVRVDDIETADIRFGYCTEFIVMLDKDFGAEEEKDFKAFLSSIGDCVVCVSDSDIVKVHVHTNDPGLALQKGLSFGALTSMKIDNMREEHNERLFKDAEKISKIQKKEEEKASASKMPPREAGFVAVSIGDGLKAIFEGLGVDHIVEGGQTMNPSTADILDAIDQVNAKTVYVMPNNSNIILTAQQAAELVEDKNVIVIPSKTVPQGITAVINYMESASPEENKEIMISEIGHVKSAQITYAVRDSVIDDHSIRRGNIMGLGDSGLLAVGEDIEQTTLDTIADMVDDDSEIISVYYGSDITPDQAGELREKLEESYSDFEIEVYEGGQPIYYYIISVE